MGKVIKIIMEKKKYNLIERLKIIDECSFKGEKNFYPSRSFLEKNTDVSNYEDRNYYLWILLNLTPETEEDLDCYEYIINLLEKFDSNYYKALRTIIEDNK